jgi:site-specific DNA recombinase
MRKRRTTAPRSGPLRAVGYIRVSTEDQSLGAEAQRDALTRWATSAGAALVLVAQDLGVSGAKPLDERPGLLEAVAALDTHGATVLVVAKRDRLARDTIVAAMLDRMAQSMGATIVSADGAGNGDSPEDVLMRRILDAVAEYERMRIKLRTKAALAVKKTRGELVGGVPFGFKLAGDGVHLEPDPAEQIILGRVLELRSSGMTIRAIANRMNDNQIPARGGRWHHTTVARILDRQNTNRRTQH